MLVPYQTCVSKTDIIWALKQINESSCIQATGRWLIHSFPMKAIWAWSVLNVTYRSRFTEWRVWRGEEVTKSWIGERDLALVTSSSSTSSAVCPTADMAIALLLKKRQEQQLLPQDIMAQLATIFRHLIRLTSTAVEAAETLLNIPTFK